MLKIGINQNAFINKLEKTEDGVLVIGFGQVGDEDNSSEIAEMKAKLEENPFADWEDGAESFSEGSNGLTVRMFPFDADPAYSTPDVMPDSNEMYKRINTLRDPLTHIILGYMTKDKNPLVPKVMFQGTGIDVNINLFPTLIMSEEVIAKVYANTVDAFIEVMTPFVNRPELAFRLKLIRQSKKKAFATLPNRFLRDNPFWESMSIPAEASKVRFTPYEIRQGLDKDTPYAEQDTADVDTAEQEPQNDPFATR